MMKGLERAFPERAYAYHAEMENRARAKYAKYGEDGKTFRCCPGCLFGRIFRYTTLSPPK